MSVFKVLREKPSEGIVFDYITEAGQMLQAPVPLPLLAKPVSGTGSSHSAQHRAAMRVRDADPINGWDSARPRRRPNTACISSSPARIARVTTGCTADCRSPALMAICERLVRCAGRGGKRHG